jgi:hypothetical protein
VLLKALWRVDIAWIKCKKEKKIINLGHGVGCNPRTNETIGLHPRMIPGWLLQDAQDCSRIAQDGGGFLGVLLYM